MKTICIGSDHAGYRVKTSIVRRLSEMGYQVRDIGTQSESSSDYPEFAHQVARRVASHDDEVGILVCGTGQGVSITANKHNQIRAALCWSQEIAGKAREHNDANVLCLPGLFLEEDQAIKIVEVFLHTGFLGGRHLRRVQGIESSLSRM